jgi:hypothetical protein
MKEIKGFSINKRKVTGAANAVQFKVTGTNGAVFSLQVKDASSPNKFYNFKTGVFTTDFTSENTLSNITISGIYNGNVNLPAAANGNTYTFLLFAYSEFDTKISDNIRSNDGLYTTDITQTGAVTIRFSTSSDQADTAVVGVGLFTNTDGTANTVRDYAGSKTSTEISISRKIADSGDGLALGYKWTLPTSTNVSNTLADSLQPKDKDFYTAITTQTDGSGTDSTSMILDSVDNLVVGMDLVDIADSSDEEQSGTLGILTYPKITAIDADAKTITLSAAPDWGDDKAVVFRAYGPRLISKSTGCVFNHNLKVYPISYQTEDRIKNYGTVTINGDMSGTSLTIDGISGVSVGSKIIGSGVKVESSANLITAIHASGTPITVTGAQVLADNTVLQVYGSSTSAIIEGTITITTFATLNTDLYYDIDRAFTLATLS